MTPPAFDRSAKAALRAQILSRRDQLSEGFRGRAQLAIHDRAAEALDGLAGLSGLAGLAAADVVALYSAKGSEVDVGALEAHARRLGFRVAYPRVVRGQRWLAFHLVDGAALRPGRFGLREPAPSEPAAEPGAIAAFLVPGIAFDEEGGRLGWGRGYYDSTFARAPQARRLGVAFECQVAARVPQTEHDISLHALFTEARVRRFGS